jgi:hypothetical protein
VGGNPGPSSPHPAVLSRVRGDEVKGDEVCRMLHAVTKGKSVRNILTLRLILEAPVAVTREGILHHT